MEPRDFTAPDSARRDRLNVQPIVEALDRLEADLHAEIETHRARAEKAERHAAELEARIAQLEAESQKWSTPPSERLVEGVNAYIEETTEAQLVLLSLVRSLIGVDEKATAGTVGPSDGAPAANQPSAGSAESAGNRTQVASPPLEGSQTAAPTHSEVPPFSSGRSDESTDEHRLLDLRNQLDMGRLDKASFVRALMTRR